MLEPPPHKHKVLFFPHLKEVIACGGQCGESWKLGVSLRGGESLSVAWTLFKGLPSSTCAISLNVSAGNRTKVLSKEKNQQQRSPHLCNDVHFSSPSVSQGILFMA